VISATRTLRCTRFYERIDECVEDHEDHLEVTVRGAEAERRPLPLTFSHE
jgi:hypothetical protein